LGAPENHAARREGRAVRDARGELDDEARAFAATLRVATADLHVVPGEAPGSGRDQQRGGDADAGGGGVAAISGTW